VLIAFDDTNNMTGGIVSYSSANGDMEVDVTSFNGSGTYTDWDVNLSGAPGPQGHTGSRGFTGSRGATGFDGSKGDKG